MPGAIQSVGGIGAILMNNVKAARESHKLDPSEKNWGAVDRAEKIYRQYLQSAGAKAVKGQIAAFFSALILDRV